MRTGPSTTARAILLVVLLCAPAAGPTGCCEAGRAAPAPLERRERAGGDPLAGWLACELVIEWGADRGRFRARLDPSGSSVTQAFSHGWPWPGRWERDGADVIVSEWPCEANMLSGMAPPVVFRLRRAGGSWEGVDAPCGRIVLRRPEAGE